MGSLEKSRRIAATDTGNIEKRVLESTPLLEAFGEKNETLIINCVKKRKCQNSQKR
jgi:hypothetical protein